MTIDADPFPELDGRSPAIARLKREMRHVARDAHVSALILGESGTGKERVARAIHRASPRAAAPFVVVNCAALSPTLAEDELFGHVRGAFTGALTDRPGPFERGHGGTIFLDEVGELTLDLQVKLLRVLQQRTVQRLGSGRETPFDVRIVSATHVNLLTAVKRGRFREDLYYRLKVYELDLPPVRRRGTSDLRQLVESIASQQAHRRHRPPPAIAQEVWAAFTTYDWPGNVRELENTLERMIVAAGDDRILTTGHLPAGFGTAPDLAACRPLPSRAEALAALARHGFKSCAAAATLGLSRHQFYRLLKRGPPAALRDERAALSRA